MRLSVHGAVICSIGFACLAVVAQSGGAQPRLAPAPPIDLPYPDIKMPQHMIGPHVAIHLTADQLPATASNNPDLFDSVSFDIVVNEWGRVDAATVTKGSPKYAEQARQMEMQRTFKPWFHDGSPIRVKLQDYIVILPPEQWAAKRVPFPESVDWKTASVTLERTVCYGGCPAYTVSIAGDGTIHFSAAAEIGFGGSRIPGDHTAQISPEVARNLILDFKLADFLSAKDSYKADVTDCPTYTLTLTLNGVKKTVVDYVGASVGMPLVIEDLEEKIDRVADTERWIIGNSNTIPSLEAERWSFGSSSSQNLALYQNALQFHDEALLNLFLNAHAPAYSVEFQEPSPLCFASGVGNLSMIGKMLPRDGDGKMLPIPVQVATQCLHFAASSGSVETLQFWLEHGGDPKEPIKPADEDGDDFSRENPSLLVLALLSNHAEMVQRVLDLKPTISTTAYPIVFEAVRRCVRPEIVQMLIDAGADVNTPSSDGVTPLFAIRTGECGRTTIPMLVRAGAKLEAKQDGQTPLTRYADDKSLIAELLAAGANPAAVADNGDTPLNVARQAQCNECVAMIEDALKARGLDVPPATAP